MTAKRTLRWSRPRLARARTRFPSNMRDNLRTAAAEAMAHPSRRAAELAARARIRYQMLLGLGVGRRLRRRAAAGPCIATFSDSQSTGLARWHSNPLRRELVRSA